MGIDGVGFASAPVGAAVPSAKARTVIAALAAAMVHAEPIDRIERPRRGPVRLRIDHEQQLMKALTMAAVLGALTREPASTG